MQSKESNSKRKNILTISYKIIMAIHKIRLIHLVVDKAEKLNLLNKANSSNPKISFKSPSYLCLVRKSSAIWATIIYLVKLYLTKILLWLLLKITQIEDSYSKMKIYPRWNFDHLKVSHLVVESSLKGINLLLS